MKHSGPTPTEDMVRQIIADCLKLHTAAWILCLSTLPPDSKTLFSEWNAKVIFIWKEDFGPLDFWNNSPVLFLLSPVKGLHVILISGAAWLEEWDAWLGNGLQPLSTLCEADRSSSFGLAWQSSHPWCLCTFSYHTVPFQSPYHEHVLIQHCANSQSCQQSPCVTLLVWGVSECVFWTTVKSAVFPIIAIRALLRTVWVEYLEFSFSDNRYETFPGYCGILRYGMFEFHDL